MFKPATPIAPRVAAVLDFCACDDWLEIGASDRSRYEINDACLNDALNYLDAWAGSQPLPIPHAVTLQRAIADYMTGQCIAYAYYLDMHAPQAS